MKKVSTLLINLCLLLLALSFLPKESTAQTPTKARSSSEVDPAKVPGTTASRVQQKQASTSELAATAAVGLQQFYSGTGNLTISADAKGTITAASTIRVNKPNAQSTVAKAILLSSVTSSSLLANNCVTLAGTPVTWAGNAQVSYFTSYWADVTSIVTNQINAFPAGISTLSVTECNTSIIEGEALLVIFNDPTATEKTIVVMTGAMNPTGDNFSITLAKPIDPAAPGALLDMGLGIGYGFQLNATNQASTITVNGQRLTSSAGGEDDGVSQNGALITVGGIDDTNANPANPLALPVNAKSDDELYTILPFINASTTNLNITTINPSQDDNIFLAYFAISGAAIVGEGILLSPTTATATVGESHTVKALVSNTLGQLVNNRQVVFKVNSGPNAGKTFTVNTNAAGEASFTYAGTSEVGTDNITACFVSSKDSIICSNNATVQWTTIVKPNIYYSKPLGDLHLTSSWGQNMDGTGLNPTDFSAGKTFMLANRPGGYFLTNNWTVGGILNVPAGSQLSINAFSLAIADLTGTGLLNGTPSSALTVNQPSTGPTTLNFSAAGGNLASLTIASSATTSIASDLNIHDVLAVQTGILNTSGFVTLRSTATNTARVATVGGTISGAVTVERYIPARRAWRILSAPVMGSQTVNAAWQEGATTSSANPNPAPGFGTHITEGNADGFDHNPLIAMPSIKNYVNNNWTPLTNTTATTVNDAPYMLFVRGDRSIELGLNTVAPNNTTLRVRGQLKTGDQTFPVLASGFTAIPNPFASPVNFATITKNNVQNNFYVWDPKLGGENGVGAYVLLSFNGTGYDVIPASASPVSQYIQSGQGFLVRSTGTAGSVTIKESDKSATPASDVFRTSETSNGLALSSVSASGTGLRISLQTVNSNNTSSVLDEVFSAYGRNYSDKVDNLDAEKIDNMEENISIVRDGYKLMVDRTGSLDEKDVIQLKVWNTKAKSYILEFNPSNLNSGISKAFLVDHFLKTTTQIDLSKTTQVYFHVTADLASANPDRFTVSFEAPEAIRSSIKAGISMYPNPISGSNIQLSFSNQPKGVYQVELLNGVGQVVFKSQIQHGGGTAVQQLKLNSQPVAGVYMLNVTNEGKRNTLKVLVNK